MFTAGQLRPPIPPCGSCRDFRPQGKGPPLGIFKACQSSPGLLGEGASASLRSHCPQVTPERGMSEKAPCVGLLASRTHGTLHPHPSSRRGGI